MLPLLIALVISAPVLLLWGAAHWGFRLVTSIIGLIGFAYPTVKSYHAMKGKDHKDFHHMVVYWFVYSLVTALNTKLALIVTTISASTTFGMLTPIIMSMIPVSLGPARLYGHAIGFLRFIIVHLPIPAGDKQEMEQAIQDAQAGKPAKGHVQEHQHTPVPSAPEAQRQHQEQPHPQPHSQPHQQTPPPYAYAHSNDM